MVVLSDMHLPAALCLVHLVAQRAFHPLRTVLVLNVALHVSWPLHDNVTRITMITHAHVTTESSLGKGGRHTVKIILGGGGF